jgi:hypothetical protein
LTELLGVVGATQIVHSAGGSGAAATRWGGRCGCVCPGQSIVGLVGDAPTNSTLGATPRIRICFSPSVSAVCSGTASPIRTTTAGAVRAKPAWQTEETESSSRLSVPFVRKRRASVRETLSHGPLLPRRRGRRRGSQWLDRPRAYRVRRKIDVAHFRRRLLGYRQLVRQHWTD